MVDSTRLTHSGHRVLVAGACALFLAAALSVAAMAATCASPTITVGDPAYDDLDRLDALGFLPGSILGHRPISQAELMELVGLADSLVARREPAPGIQAVDPILRRLRARYQLADRRPALGLPAFGAGISGGRRELRPIPASNGLGGIAGGVSPLDSYRLGVPFAGDGPTAWLSAGGSTSLTTWLAAGASGEIRLLADREPLGEGDFRGRILTAQLRAQWANIVFQVGREHVAWGPLPRGGSLLSANARALDLVLLTCDRPYRFPGFLRYVGAVRQTFLAAALGSGRVPEHSRLVAVRQTFRVTRHLELGFSETLILGGQGAPGVSPGQFLYELIPFQGRNGRHDLSDHRYGMDGRIQLWPGRLLAYGDVFIDDSRAPLYKYFDTLLAKRVGLYAPAFGPGGRFQARLEYAQVPAIAYRHGRWMTGYAAGGLLLGDALGPDARGGHAELSLTWPAGDQLTLALDREGRDRDLWGQDPGDTPDRGKRIYRIENLPTEWRTRALLTGRWRASPVLDLLPRAGVERTTRRLDTGTDETGWVVEIGAEYRPW